MLVTVNSTTITETDITLDCTNLEPVLTADDLFQEIPEETVRFNFSREQGGKELRYLWKICSSNRNVKNEKSFGEMIEKLATSGCIISISENFIVR